MYLLLSPSLPVPLTLLFNSLLSILPLSSSSFSFRQFPLSRQSLLSPLLLSSLLLHHRPHPTSFRSLFSSPCPLPFQLPQTALPTPLGPAAPGRERSQPSSAATSLSFLPLVSCLPSLLIRPDPRLLSPSPATPSPPLSYSLLSWLPLTLTSPLPTVLSAWRPPPSPGGNCNSGGLGSRGWGGGSVSRFASPGPYGPPRAAPGAQRQPPAPRNAKRKGGA